LFLLLLWPVVLVFGNIFILFGRYIVLVDFHVHGEQQMLRKKKKSLFQEWNHFVFIDREIPGM